MPYKQRKTKSARLSHNIRFTQHQEFTKLSKRFTYALIFNNMVNLSVWRSAERPNYKTNVDLRFPYSEVNYLGEYELVKIPVSLKNLIPHVDYWGEGKVMSKKGIRGFSNCYNVNHQYQLVSSGPDLDRKIPNRVPVLSDDNCDTSSYINENSVLTVTVSEAARITSSCAKDIARIVNDVHGVVIVYGVQNSSRPISEHTVELAKILVYLESITNVTLPREFQGLTYYDTHVAFIKSHIIMDQLYKSVITGQYDTAVEIVKRLRLLELNVKSINSTVMRLISACPRNTMSFAYKLWHGGVEDIVRNHFPKTFQHIFNADVVMIVNEQYQQSLILDVNTDYDQDRLSWGYYNIHTNIPGLRMRWKLLSVWSSDASGVTFKLYNIHYSMCLKLEIGQDTIGDKRAFGSTSCNEDRHRYYLEPSITNGALVYFLINYKYSQGLKLAKYTDSDGYREVWGHNGRIYNGEKRFRWVIKAI